MVEAEVVMLYNNECEDYEVKILHTGCHKKTGKK